MTVSPSIVFDFQDESNNRNWKVVDDVVMGGRSNGHFFVNSAGHGVFEGSVSQENNGGFSSVRHRIEIKAVTDFHNFSIRLKGDGKRYQFRVKSNSQDDYSYIMHFETTGQWQTIDIPMNTMYASFRGRKLDLPEYPGQNLKEIAFLIANKKAEDFSLEIDRIELNYTEFRTPPDP